VWKELPAGHSLDLTLCSLSPLGAHVAMCSQPWQHYVPVRPDFSDLLERIAGCEADLPRLANFQRWIGHAASCGSCVGLQDGTISPHRLQSTTGIGNPQTDRIVQVRRDWPAWAGEGEVVCKQHKVREDLSLEDTFEP
jgi:hypothetical protein